MKRIKSPALLLGATGLLLSSCIDDNYDLSDIDTTARVDVKDLVIPINIDAIKLSNIFDLKESDRIKVIDGSYALVETGEFSSDNIRIEKFDMTAPEIESTEATISLTPELPPEAQGVAACYPVKSRPSSYDFSAANISSYINRIDSVKTKVSLRATISFLDMGGKFKSFTLKGVKIQFPKGMNVTPTAGQTYDSNTGVVTLADRKVQGNSVNIDLNVTGLDFAKAGGTYSPELHKATMTGPLNVIAGYVTFNPEDFEAGLAGVPETLEMRNDYWMSDLDIEQFDGEIHYEVDGVDVPDVDLDNLPEFLNQDGTKIILANPQIYLNVENPLHEYDLYAQTGFSITSYPRDNENPFTNSIDAPYFTIPSTGTSKTFNFLLSPTVPEKYYPGYTDPIYVKYTSLSNVLAADNGLPQRLAINIDPVVPVQNVRNFKLGKSLGEVIGNYTFYAPIELLEGSHIIYSDTVDGWSSEDLDYLTIEKLVIKAEVSSDMPLGATLKGYPIDVDGRQINGVQIEGAQINANAKNQPIEIYITGPVTKLDGIIFRATINSEPDAGVLKPDMTITLRNVRPCLSGYYQKEF